MAKPRPLVYLIGDAPLVQEFGEICFAAGYAVACTARSGQKISPKHFKKSTTVPRMAYIAVELTNTDTAIKRKNLRSIDRAIPRPTIILSSSVTVTTTEQASWIRHPDRLVGIGALPTLLSGKLIELAASLQTNRATISDAGGFFAKLGKETALVQDRVGMVMPRILCALINEAFFALTENIASPDDIDGAMKLGANYPIGPIEWADKIGIQQVLSVLGALHADLGEERYRISPLLKQMAASGPWLPT